jgi:hypothetical protein
VTESWCCALRCREARRSGPSRDHAGPACTRDRTPVSAPFQVLMRQVSRGECRGSGAPEPVGGVKSFRRWAAQATHLLYARSSGKGLVKLASADPQIV